MNIDLISRYYDYNTDPDAFQYLNDPTRDDLDLDALFFFLDHNISSVGRQYLYNLLCNIPLESPVKKQEDWIRLYESDRPLQQKINRLLKKLNHTDAYYICSLFQIKKPVISSFQFLIWRILQLLPFAFLVAFLLFQVRILLLLCGVVFIVNLIVHYKNKQTAFLYAGSIPQLLKMINIAKSLFNQNALKDLNPTIEPALKNVSKLKNSLLLFRFDSKIDSDISLISWSVSEFIRIFFLLEPISLFKAFRLLELKSKDIETLFNYIGLIDNLQSVSVLRRELPYYCLPGFASANKIEAEQLYHPLIHDCVPNTITMNKKSLLIMGSNMSGKTSLIRTVGVNVLSGQTLNTCFAESFHCTRMRIYSAINSKDDLVQGKSYYLEEVLRLKEIITQTQSGANLILLDELFKGTNTIERIAAAKATLNYFVRNSQNAVLVATHDLELAGLLKDQYTLSHFTEQVEEETLSFDYKIKEGIPTSRNALRILEMNAYPEALIQEANDCVLNSGYPD